MKNINLVLNLISTLLSIVDKSFTLLVKHRSKDTDTESAKHSIKQSSHGNEERLLDKLEI